MKWFFVSIFEIIMDDYEAKLFFIDNKTNLVVIEKDQVTITQFLTLAMTIVLFRALPAAFNICLAAEI